LPTKPSLSVPDRLLLPAIKTSITTQNHPLCQHLHAVPRGNAVVPVVFRVCACAWLLCACLWLPSSQRC
jgi:hypothetical protein